MADLQINNILTDIKRKFFIFSLAGILLTSIASYFTLTMHSQIVSRQASLQTMYYKVARQLNLISRISELVQRSSETISGVNQITTADDLKGMLSNLSQESWEFNEWLTKNKSDDIANIKALLEERSVEREVKLFIQSARELAYNRDLTLEQTKAHIDFLSANSQVGLGKGFHFISTRLESEIEKAMITLDRVAYLLVGVCFIQVFLVWLLIFRPLYHTIFLQHGKISEALLKAESASRSKTDFLANISHEIRTPMTAILGYSALLKRDEITVKKRENFISIIDKNAKHLMGLIDEILDIAKMESGRFNFVKEEVNLVKLLNEVYSLLNVKAGEKDIELVFYNNGEIPEVIYSDEKRIKQILFNIIGNAIKFTDSGTVKVNVKFLKKQNQVSFKVADTGRGISYEHQKKLFRPFEQADTSVNRKFGGTGLGLVLAREMAHGLGGDVTILNSHVGVGTTFEILLSAGKLSNDVKFSTNFSTSEVEGKTKLIKKQLLEKIRILVVDDAKENARLFKAYLANAGAEVEIANDGESAIEKASKSFFDLVLLDLQMPGKDGFQVLRELKQIGFDKPIVAITAHAMKEEKVKTKRAGFDDHICKPVQAGDLVEAVHYHVNVS